MAELMNALGIGGKAATICIALFLLLNVIGEICTKMDKVVPSFMKVITNIKKKRKDKREKLKDQEDTLKDVKKLLTEVNKHYDADNIKKRDEWMKQVNETVSWVHTKANNYDNTIQELKQDFEQNRKLAEFLFIQNCRTTILDFASKTAHPDYLATKDEFRRVFKVYEEYEEFLRNHHMENGEIDDAMEVIHAEYQDCLRTNNFLEAKRR